MESSFHWADYVVFVALLLLSAGIGVFFGIKDRKAANPEAFLMAGRNMSVGPVAISMFATIMSSIAFVGDPVEAYYFGASYLVLSIGGFLGAIPVAQIFAPKFHKMQLVSAFEFLEVKYNATVRKFASIGQVLCLILMMAIILYAPSIALSQASGISVVVGILSTTFVCTFYTTFGGMKAVLWADTIQMVIMFIGLFTLLIASIVQMGGFSEIWRIAMAADRLDIFLRMNPNPFERSNFWTYLIGGFFRVLIPFASSQLCIQRYCTVKTSQDATKVIYWTIPMFLTCTLVFFVLGLTMYAIWPCDPFLINRITRRDQMVPLLVLQILGFMPGVPGLFIACLFSASLSTLSSGQNALAANILSDFFTPWYEKKYGKQVPGKLGILVSKSIAAAVGMVVMGLAFVIMLMGSSVFEVANQVMGMFGGPLCGLFIAALAFPSIQTRDIIIGFVTSMGICLWWGLGALSCIRPLGVLPLRLDGCPAPGNTTSLNVTLDTLTTTQLYDDMMTSEMTTNANNIIAPAQNFCTGIAYLYRLSPMLYAPLGIILTVGVAWIHAYVRRRIEVRRRRKEGIHDDTSASEEEETKKMLEDSEDDVRPSTFRRGHVDRSTMTQNVTLLDSLRDIRFSMTPSLNGFLTLTGEDSDAFMEPQQQEKLWVVMRESVL